MNKQSGTLKKIKKESELPGTGGTKTRKCEEDRKRATKIILIPNCKEQKRILGRFYTVDDRDKIL